MTSKVGTPRSGRRGPMRGRGGRFFLPVAPLRRTLPRRTLLVLESGQHVRLEKVARAGDQRIVARLVRPRKSADAIRISALSQGAGTPADRVRDRLAVRVVDAAGVAIGGQSAAASLTASIVSDLATPVPDERVLQARRDLEKLGEAIIALGGGRLQWPSGRGALEDAGGAARYVARFAGGMREILLEPTHLGVRVWLEVAEPGAPIGLTLAGLGLAGEAPLLARRS